jgi:hypothetical protein
MLNKTLFRRGDGESNSSSEDSALAVSLSPLTTLRDTSYYVSKRVVKLRDDPADPSEERAPINPGRFFRPLFFKPSTVSSSSRILISFTFGSSSPRVKRYGGIAEDTAK